MLSIICFIICIPVLFLIFNSLLKVGLLFFTKIRKFNNLKREIKQKEDFVANLTHDLKTPLLAQKRMLELLLNGKFGFLSKEQTEALNITYSSVEYLNNLVYTILDTYKCDYGQLKIEPNRFDIIDLIYEVISSIKILSEMKKQNILFNHSLKEFYISADKLKLKRVLINLLSNAIKFGFEHTNISINFIYDERNIMLSIENKTKHVSHEILQSLFKKFVSYKLDGFNSIGTGLGLYISKQIIDIHNGKIYAKSFPDGTCVFSFSIPINCNKSKIYK